MSKSVGANSPGHNVFVVRQGRLLTPRAHNVLNGITRQVVMELAPPAGVAVMEADLTVYDLGAALLEPRLSRGSVVI